MEIMKTSLLKFNVIETILCEFETEVSARAAATRGS